MRLQPLSSRTLLPTFRAFDFLFLSAYVFILVVFYSKVSEYVL